MGLSLLFQEQQQLPVAPSCSNTFHLLRLFVLSRRTQTQMFFFCFYFISQQWIIIYCRIYYYSFGDLWDAVETHPSFLLPCCYCSGNHRRTNTHVTFFLPPYQLLSLSSSSLLLLSCTREAVCLPPAPHSLTSSPPHPSPLLCLPSDGWEIG